MVRQTTDDCRVAEIMFVSEQTVAWKDQVEYRSAKKSLIQASREQSYRKHLASATTAEKKLGYLFRARKYSSPSNLLTLYKAQIRPSLEYCSHIWGAAAPITLFVPDAVKRMAIRLIGGRLQGGGREGGGKPVEYMGIPPASVDIAFADKCK
nr:unnamed protein product [Callosobruchus chinensis]